MVEPQLERQRQLFHVILLVVLLVVRQLELVRLFLADQRSCHPDCSVDVFFAVHARKRRELTVPDIGRHRREPVARSHVGRAELDAEQYRNRARGGHDVRGSGPVVLRECVVLPFSPVCEPRREPDDGSCFAAVRSRRSLTRSSLRAANDKTECGTQPTDGDYVVKVSPEVVRRPARAPRFLFSTALTLSMRSQYGSTTGPSTVCGTWITLYQLEKDAYTRATSASTDLPPLFLVLSRTHRPYAPRPFPRPQSKASALSARATT